MKKVREWEIESKMIRSGTENKREREREREREWIRQKERGYLRRRKGERESKMNRSGT